MSGPPILLAIENPAVRAQVRGVLEGAGYYPYDRLPADILPTLLLFDRFPASVPSPSIYIATGGSEEAAVAALRAGCRDYVREDRLADELPAAVERCLAVAAERPKSDAGAASLIGSGESMRALRSYVLKVAATGSNVLITGETGTGKELVAQLVHANSRRRNGPLVCLNCAAIPDSLLESELFGHQRGAFTGAYTSRDGLLKQADGGTILLDEIADMSAYAQAKLLRAIETRQVQRLGATRSESVDFRIVAATNRPLNALTEDDRFRRDLYFRLNVARIELPPLRERKEDIPLLLAGCIREMNPVFGRRLEGVSQDALRWLLAYDWPGNIRELRNLVEASFIDQPEGSTRLLELPAALRAKAVREEPRNERDRLVRALCATDWNKTETARHLKWSRMTLYRKLAKYHLVTGDFKVRGASGPKV